MVEFRVPDVLDPQMVDINPRRVPAEDLVVKPTSLEDHFERACEYGRSLWNELAEVRRYLRDDIGGSGADEEIPAHPAMLPPDAQSWQQWAEVYAHVCSALAGTSGDSGFGRSEAAIVARAHGIEIAPLR